MKKMGIALALICTGLFLAPVGAQAQATRTWVSGVGSDSNTCSRTAPCQTLAWRDLQDRGRRRDRHARSRRLRRP